VSKANQILGMIKRSFSDISKEIVIPLYKSLVRPHLEYCSQIWNPHYIKDIKLIEGFQHTATKGMEGLHYDDRLKCLNLMRLETRRVRSELIETFKIVNGKYSINSFLNTTKVEEVESESGRRGHSKKLFKLRGPDWTLKIFHSQYSCR